MFSGPVLLPATTLMRPEKPVRKFNPLEKVLVNFSGLVAGILQPMIIRKNRFIHAVHLHARPLTLLDDRVFRNEVLTFKKELYRTGYSQDRLALAFALIREASRRTLGLEHFDVQLLGGLEMFYGNVTEMKTGEGKTLTASLPAAAAAMQGIPVHIITVNDYLAGRDAEELRPAYELLGLSVGCITHGLTPDQRREQYARNIVYCTNNEIVFDYLKDNLIISDRSHPLLLHVERMKPNHSIEKKLLLRGLHFAIIDEADSVLMDEARTPLIISGEEAMERQQEDMYHQAITTARELEQTADFSILWETRNIELTDRGKDRVYADLSRLGGFWRSRVRTFELVLLALSALHLYQRDKQYLVREGRIEIIDEHTGRIMPGRSWERGLHQLIELKEGCRLTKPRKTLARISYQNFFRKYHHLCGMTGTAREVAGEFRTVYGLRVINIPTHKPCIRIRKPVCVTGTVDDKWQQVMNRVRALKSMERPVLIGTTSVEASESLSRLLSANGLEHQLLNAKQDQYEADIIARAGQPGQITIATNMAGRGTDIKLEDSVRKSGGLYVILTELHDAGRIDRQLEGRCARQGDPGEFEMIISTADHLMQRELPAQAYAVLKRLCPEAWWMKTGFIIMKLAQKSVEARHHKVRAQLMKFDEKQKDLLSFSGAFR